jgi:Predicted periplasmic or secreted lipoprotein
MRRLVFVAAAGLAILGSGSTLAAQPDRPLVEAMRNVYRLTTYTAFDWISAHYLKGTLTLQGFSRTERLKQQAEEAARKASGIDDVINQIEVLPPGQGDDNIRVRAYSAIYSSAGLERYAPGGQLSKAATDELANSGRFGLDGGDIGRGPHGIHVIVNAARVLLIGDVKARQDRQMAEGAVRTLPGVLGVQNQLRVQGQK